MTASRGRGVSTLHALEGLRGIAALAVALYHLHLVESGPLDHGYLMVDLFFVLSGFILFLNYGDRLGHRSNLRPFLIRRAGRLLPLYFATTLATFVALDVVATVWNASNHVPPLSENLFVPGWRDIVANLTLTSFLSEFDARVVNWPSWSIGTELYTYLLFAGVCLWVPRARRLAVVAAIAGGAALVFIAMRVGSDACLSEGKCLDAYRDAGFLRCAAGFFLGGLLESAWRAIGQRFDAPAWRAMLERAQWPAAAVLVATIAVVPQAPAAAFLVPLLSAALIFALLPDAGPIARFLKRPSIQALGRWSYSIYLVHAMLTVVVEFAVRRLSIESPVALTAVALVYVAALLALSRWTYRAIEVPARDRANQWARGLSTPRAGQAAVTSGVAVNR